MSSVSVANKLTRGEKQMLLRIASSANDASVTVTPKNLEEKFILKNLEKMGLATQIGDSNEFQASDKSSEIADEVRAAEAS